MRRKIELWINGHQADISDQSLVLWNYALTDLQKPTAVKNGYSKQITLPGTPANAEIFGHLSRPDRTAEGGFNPLERTPFAIYDELGRILESGYLKLDSVTRRHSVVTGYTVSLYGGLGSFFYGLMYNDAGEQRKLYDMDYYIIPGEGFEPHVVSFDRTITKELIRNSWQWIDVSDRPSLLPLKALYAGLNFLPCYNGIPSDGFDADKVIVKPDSVGEGISGGIAGIPGYTNGSAGIPQTLTDDDGNTVTPYHGYGLVTLGEKMTEWEMRDIRSYLQRPILNIQAFLNSLSQPENNGGWTLDWKTRPFDERNLWMTLRPLSTIDYSSEETQNIDITLQQGTQLKDNGGLHQETIVINNGVKGTSTLNIGVTVKLRDYSEAGSRPSILYCAYDRIMPFESDVICSSLMLQAVGYDGNGNAVAHSDLVIMTNTTPDRPSIDAVARESFESGLGRDYNAFTPVGVTSYGDGTAVSEGHFEPGNVKEAYTEYNWTGGTLALSLTGPRIVRVVVSLGWVAEAGLNSEREAVGMWRTLRTASLSARAGYNPTVFHAIAGTNTLSITAVRSGVTVSAEQLLNTDHSIGDYLLSLAKVYGWIFTADQATKTITVWDRNSFFSTGEEAIDLSARIDLSKDITIAPLYAESQIYKFELDPWGTAYAEQYEQKYSQKYGSKRINTGYRFTAAEINLAADIVFKPAVEVVARGHRYSWIYKTAEGNWQFGWEAVPRTITYGGIGEDAFSRDYMAVYPDGYSHFSTALPFADCDDRIELCDKEGKQLDGDGVLVYMRPRSEWGQYARGQRFQLSDDFDEMYFLNEGKPCWLCAFESADTLLSSAIPSFGFYAALYDTDEDEWTYGDNLLFGIPAEINDAYAENFSEEKCWYHKYWRNYLGDLLDKDTKIMRCRVDLSGLQVGPELLRRFFWYDNSLWVLNKITNYSLTTWDPAECEFVQVRNTSNYTNGQILD